jgi:dihydroorotase
VKLDLIIKGGRVLDTAQGLDKVADVGVFRGRIAAIDSDLEGAVTDSRPRIVDAEGAVVTPGLIDVHAHVYTGVCPLTVHADEMCGPAGVTTVVSAGDAGAHTVEGFRQLIVNQSRTRVLCFLHISSIGLASFPVGESLLPALLDVEAAETAISLFPDLVVGIKVRQGGAGVTGDNGLEPLRRALTVGESTARPVMVHITDSEAPLADLLSLLRPGDIVTHCFTGTSHGIVEAGGLKAVQEARARGVIFDVGHGAGSFDFDAAELAGNAGFWPDTISTDLHSISAPMAESLPVVMSKMLAIGMPLTDVITATTARAAQVIHRGDTLGSLGVGRVADLTVLDLKSPEVEYRDTFGHVRHSTHQLSCRASVRAGVVWGAPTHPGVGVAVLDR